MFAKQKWHADDLGFNQKQPCETKNGMRIMWVNQKAMLRNKNDMRMIWVLTKSNLAIQKMACGLFGSCSRVIEGEKSSPKVLHTSKVARVVAFEAVVTLHTAHFYSSHLVLGSVPPYCAHLCVLGTTRFVTPTCCSCLSTKTLHTSGEHGRDLKA